MDSIELARGIRRLYEKSFHVYHTAVVSPMGDFIRYKELFFIEPHWNH
jgi:hypothetical protein